MDNPDRIYLIKLKQISYNTNAGEAIKINFPFLRYVTFENYHWFFIPNGAIHFIDNGQFVTISLHLKQSKCEKSNCFPLVFFSSIYTKKQRDSKATGIIGGYDWLSSGPTRASEKHFISSVSDNLIQPTYSNSVSIIQLVFSLSALFFHRATIDYVKFEILLIICQPQFEIEQWFAD